MAKIIKGVVISLSTPKTAIVKVERAFSHPIYKKTIKRHKKYKAHYDNTDLQINDTVQIIECRPISKDKHFKILKKVK